MKFLTLLIATMALMPSAQAGNCTYSGRTYYYSLVVEYDGDAEGPYTTCHYLKKDAKANWYYRCADGTKGYMDRNSNDESNFIHSRAGVCKHTGLF